MKIFIPIQLNDIIYLRQKNPLENSRYLVSAETYAIHETQYIATAVLILNPEDNKIEYLENQLKGQWQFCAANSIWTDISEPNFIDTISSDYRYVFKYISNENKQSETYQDKVKSWLINCFNEETAVNIPERALRFLEESLELVQACGLNQIQAQRLVTYIYNRPVGNRAQESGGVMVTLAALCSANGLNMQQEGEIELSRVLSKIPEIREKQNLKTSEGITAT